MLRQAQYEGERTVRGKSTVQGGAHGSLILSLSKDEGGANRLIGTAN